MALIEAISEKAFKQLAKRLRRVLQEQNPTAEPPLALATAQETLCKMLGFGSYHALQQQWQAALPRPSDSADSVEGPSAPQSEGESPDRETGRAGDELPTGPEAVPTAPAAASDVGPWTADEEAVWRALPRLYRHTDDGVEVPSDHVAERRIRIAGWEASEPLWQEGILAHEHQSDSEFLAWAAAHPEAANALGWWPGTPPTNPFLDEDDLLSVWYYNFPPQMWSLGERFVRRDIETHHRLRREAGWPSFVRMPRSSKDDWGFARQLWAHPQAGRLLADLPEQDLPVLIGDLIETLWPLCFREEEDAYIPFSERAQVIGPVMEHLAARLAHTTDPQVQLAWEHLLDKLEDHLRGAEPQDRVRVKPAPLRTRMAQSLPGLFHYRYANDWKGFSEWALQGLYAHQSTAWQEALSLLSKPATPDSLSRWQDWLVQQGPDVVKVQGATANAPDGLPVIALVKSAPQEYYVAWLQAGLPPAYPKGPAAWQESLARGLPKGPFGRDH
jgi:hypothetical protein